MSSVQDHAAVWGLPQGRDVGWQRLYLSLCHQRYLTGHSSALSDLLLQGDPPTPETHTPHREVHLNQGHCLCLVLVSCERGKNPFIMPNKKVAGVSLSSTYTAFLLLIQARSDKYVVYQSFCRKKVAVAYTLGLPVKLLDISLIILTRH